MSKQSVAAYIEQVKSGKLKSTKDKLYYALSASPHNLDQLRNRLRIKHQTLTSSLSRLMDDGLVSQDDKGVFFVTPLNQIAEEKESRYQEKVSKWIKQGRDNGYWDIATQRMVENFYGEGEYDPR
jgi:predicted transcriptional regulator